MVKKRMQQTSKRARRKAKASEIVEKTMADMEWVESRMRLAGYKSQRELNLVIFNSVGVLPKRLAGQARWNLEEVAKFASMLGQSFEETARRLGFKLPVQRTQVIGVVRPDARVSTVTGRVGEMVAALPNPDMTLRALIFETPEGPLAGYNGLALHYRPVRSVEAEAFGRLSVVEVEGEPLAVIGTLDRAAKGAIRVTLVTGDVIEGKRILAAVPIEGIMKP